MTKLPEGWTKKTNYYIEHSDGLRRVCGAKVPKQGWRYTPWMKMLGAWEMIGPACATLEEALVWFDE